MNIVYVSLLGQLAEFAGSNFLVMNNMKDTQSLVSTLQKKFPQLNDLNFKLFLKHEFISQNQKLKNGDEVALLMPYA